jgi:choline dehydrogenase-like flavoprotein
MYTPLILWRSGFGRVKTLGRHLSLHPSFRVMGLFDAPVRGWEGALQSAYSDALEASDGLLFNSAFVPNGVLAGTTPGVGPEFYKRTQGLNRLSLFGGMIHDDAGGRLWKVPGREPLMTYRMSPRDRARIPKLLKLMGDIYFSAGAQQVILPIFGQQPLTPERFQAMDFDRVKASRLEVSSQHPLGTAQMGKVPHASVVDEDGAVWGTQGLHVACGSIMPSSLGVNPQIAIMAMALRVASRLVG